MKRILGLLAIVATSAVLSAANIRAAEELPANDTQKDECLLMSMNCPDNVDSIQQRIERLNNEIAKGAAVYTNDELNILRNKLDDAYKELDELTSS